MSSRSAAPHRSAAVIWRYPFAPDGTETLDTESYDVIDPVKRPMWFMIERVCGRRGRRTDLREGMAQTLDRLRAALEAQMAPTRTRRDPPISE